MGSGGATTYYKIQRSPDGSTGWTQVGTSLSTSFADSSVSPSTTYFYRVFPAAYSGTLHLYALDWDTTSRRETITVDDGSGPQTANITTDSSQGAWVNVPINVAAGGTVTIAVSRTAGLNVVLSGVFLGG